jgi:hypothetical protein
MSFCRLLLQLPLPCSLQASQESPLSPLRCPVVLKSSLLETTSPSSKCHTASSFPASSFDNPLQDCDGRPSRKFGLTWSDSPLQLACSAPFVLALLPKGIEVACPQLQSTCQMLHVRGSLLVAVRGSGQQVAVKCLLVRLLVAASFFNRRVTRRAARILRRSGGKLHFSTATCAHGQAGDIQSCILYHIVQPPVFSVSCIN